MGTVGKIVMVTAVEGEGMSGTESAGMGGQVRLKRKIRSAVMDGWVGGASAARMRGWKGLRGVRCGRTSVRHGQAAARRRGDHGRAGHRRADAGVVTEDRAV